MIFYGWPSTINGANDKDGPNSINAAALHFSRYNYVVLGGGIEDPKHGDHLKTKALIAQVKNTKFFGYIPLGNRKNVDPCLEMKDIQTQVQGWAKMAVKGVLLDEFGFDYSVTRTRQNDAVNAVHKAKLLVITNAWDPDHVFLADPAGVKPTLKNDSDIYLWESYRFANGKPVDLKEWRAKAEKIEKGRKELPLLVFSVSTNQAQPANANARFAHQWYSAAIDGHAATGWGYPTFGANAPTPLVTAPMNKNRPIILGELDPTIPIVVDGTSVIGATSLGKIEVDTEKLTGTFDPKKK